MRLTIFEKYILSFVLIVVATFVCFSLTFPYWILLAMLIIYFTGIFLLILADDLTDIVAFKYKIVEEKGFLNSTEYHAKVLVFWWKSVKTTFHTYKTQNMFGAKMTGGYSTEDIFSSKEKALEQHKQNVKINRKVFFKRSKKEEKIITYV